MNSDLTYAGIERRIGAGLLDTLFLVPVMISILWLNTFDRLVPILAVGVSLGVGVFYQVYLIRRFGGTPGKVLAGLRIVKIDGSAIGYREAILRALPDAGFNLLLTTGAALAALKMSEADYASLAFTARAQRLNELQPDWFMPVDLCQNVWIGSEFIVLLTNEKRRALHDFIAGTVVVLRTPTPAVTVPAPESVSA